MIGRTVCLVHNFLFVEETLSFTNKQLLAVRNSFYEVQLSKTLHMITKPYSW